MRPTLRGLFSLVAMALWVAPSAVSGEVDVETCIQILERNNPGQTMRRVTFAEYRHFPFRSKPAIVEGTARVHPQLGVSIEYPEKQAALIVDDDGAVFRRFRANGEFRDRSLPSRGASASDLMAAALTFDVAALREQFVLSAEGEPEAFVLRMEPKAPADSDVAGVSLHAVEGQVKRIEIAMTGGRSIEIQVLEETVVEAFSKEEAERYFRNTDDR